MIHEFLNVFLLVLRLPQFYAISYSEVSLSLSLSLSLSFSLSGKILHGGLQVFCFFFFNERPQKKQTEKYNESPNTYHSDLTIFKILPYESLLSCLVCLSFSLVKF